MSAADVTLDFATFFDIYMRPTAGRMLNRDGIEFRYAAAAVLIACSKADMDEDPMEKQVIRSILNETFKISEKTIDRLISMADAASEGEYLDQVTSLIRQQFSERDKRFLLEKLWRVAYADGRIDRYEEEFIDRVAREIDMTNEDVTVARALAGN